MKFAILSLITALSAIVHADPISIRCRAVDVKWTEAGVNAAGEGKVLFDGMVPTMDGWLSIGSNREVFVVPTPRHQMSRESETLLNKASEPGAQNVMVSAYKDRVFVESKEISAVGTRTATLRVRKIEISCGL